MIFRLKQCIVFIVICLAFANGYGQSGFVIRNSEGELEEKRVNLDKACNSDSVFIICASLPTFKTGYTSLIDTLNNLIHIDPKIKGYITIMFLINCEDIASGFVTSDRKFTELSDIIIEELEKLQGWSSGIQRGKKIDSYKTLHLKIKKGMIKE